MSRPAAYVPGVCNINSTEVVYRKRWAYFGTYIFIILGGIMLLGEASWWLRLILFIPGFIGAINFLEARNKFCVSYALNGVQQARETSRKAIAVSDTNQAIDKAKAGKMNFQAAIIALLATALLSFI
jgi:hypothetical protein